MSANRITEAMVEAYKHAFGDYLNKVTRGLVLPPTPDVGWHATKYALEAAASLSQEPGVAEGWRPIETAPKKPMERILLAFPDGRVSEGYWGAAKYNRSTRQWEQNWVTSPHSGPVRPTHWMPLPNPPSG